MTTWSETLRVGFNSPVILRSTSLPEAVAIATKAVAEHLLQSGLLRQYLERLPKGSGTNCPGSPVVELVKYVATQRGDINKSDPRLNLAFHREFIKPVFDFERSEVLRAAMLAGDSSSQEMHLLAVATRIADHHDQLWAAWYEKVVVPYASLDAEGKSKYEQFAQGQLAQFDYTAFDFDPEKGCVNPSPWLDAFPDQMHPIIGMLTGLAVNPQTDPALAAYFGALGMAFYCDDISELESQWAEVDRVWVKIPSTCRIVPTHGMESGYEHPFCVSPEFRIDVRTDESRDVIDRSREATIGYAADLGLGQDLIDITKQKLDHIDIGVFVNAIRAGVSLNFRYAGQAVPNRQDIVSELGGRIFIDQAGQHLPLKSYIEYLDKYCTPETAEALKVFITPRSLCIHTVVHEYAHPVGRTKESDAALGSAGMKLLEEAKASLLGVVADEWRNPSPKNRLELIAVTVARLIRFMRKNVLENTTAAPYVRENFVAATTLFDAGVLYLMDKGIAVHLGMAQSYGWFFELRLFNQALLEAYKDHNLTSLQGLTDEFCNRENEPIAGLIQWVNSK